MQRKVEVSRTTGQNFEDKTGLTFNRDVREAMLTFGTITGTAGRGRYRYATVLTKDLHEYRVKVPGGFWARSGKKYVCVDLDHPLETPKGIVPQDGTEVGFELSDPTGINELWVLTEHVRIVGAAKSACVCATRHRPTKEVAELGAMDECIRNRIETGDLPDDGIEVLRKNGWLTPPVCEKLDEYGIKY